MIVGGGPVHARGLPNQRQPSSAHERQRLQRSELPVPGATPGRPGRVGRPAQPDEHHRHQRDRAHHGHARPATASTRDYGSFATYDIGKVLVAGGGNITEDGQSNVPTKTAVVVDVNSGSSVSSTASMSVGRRQHNLTVLADGSVLATGGQSSSVDGLVDLVNPVFAAERWNPATGTWTVLSSASRVREYHSSATLLPDGRVLTGGGGICGSCQTKGYLEKNIEYFQPPYLFKNDGSGQPADRPVIDSAPDDRGLRSKPRDHLRDKPDRSPRSGLVRLGAPTHSEDQGQRYVPLSFSTSGTTITAVSPATSNIAPAGYYMLFVTDSAGVPSVAKIIKLQRGSTNPRRRPALGAQSPGSAAVASTSRAAPP